MARPNASQIEMTQIAAWAISFILHAVLVDAFVSNRFSGVAKTSNSTVDLIFSQPSVNRAMKSEQKPRARVAMSKYLKSNVEAVDVKPVASPSEIASSAEAAVFAAAGDQNAPQTARDAYVMRLRGMIEKNKSYPIRARQLGLSGQVVVSFTILASGHVTDVKVEKPCHHNILNQHAVEIVEHIENFEPIPQELGLSHWHMTVPIEFALN